MKKLWKSCLVFCTALCLALFAFAFVACGEPDTITYTVTITTPDNTAVQGVKVKFGSYDAVTTDTNGKASKTLEPGEYNITLSDVPSGYSYDPVKTTKTDKEISVQLKTDAYTVTVKLPNGDPVQGVGVGWCTIPTDGGQSICSMPVLTNANGVATNGELTTASYHIQLMSGIPSGYTYSKVADTTYYTTDATPSARSVTITLIAEAATADYSVTVLYPDGTTPVSGVMVNLTPSAGGVKTATTNANGVAAFSSLEETSYAISLSALPTGFTYEKKAGTNVSAVGATAEDKDVSVPLKAEPELKIKSAGTYKVFFTKNTTYAEIVFAPTAAGVYKLTSSTAKYDPKVAYIASSTDTGKSYDELYDDLKNDNASESEKNFCYDEIEVYEDQVGKIELSFRVYLNAKEADGTTDTTYPALFDVVLTKTGDAPEAQVNYVKATQVTEKYGPQSGTLVAILPKDPSTNMADEEILKNVKVVKGSDGYYHLGSETGSVIVVRLTTKNAYFLDPLIFDENADPNYEGTSFYQIGNNDYILMLKGKEWRATGNPTEEHYYAKYVNDDGVYPLTDELKDFLVEYSTRGFGAGWVGPLNGAQQANYYLFACYTYEAADELSENPLEITFADTGNQLFSFTADQNATFKLQIKDFDGAGISPVLNVTLNGEVIFDSAAATANQDGWFESDGIAAKANERVALSVQGKANAHALLKIAKDKVNTTLMETDKELSFYGVDTEGVTVGFAASSDEYKTGAYYTVAVTAPAALENTLLFRIALAADPEYTVVYEFGNTSEDPTPVTKRTHLFLPAAVSVTVCTAEGTESEVRVRLTKELAVGKTVITDTSCALPLGAPFDGFYDLTVKAYEAGNAGALLSSPVTLTVNGTDYEKSYSFTGAGKKETRVFVPADARILLSGEYTGSVSFFAEAKYLTVGSPVVFEEFRHTAASKFTATLAKGAAEGNGSYTVRAEGNRDLPAGAIKVQIANGAALTLENANEYKVSGLTFENWQEISVWSTDSRANGAYIRLVVQYVPDPAEHYFLVNLSGSDHKNELAFLDGHTSFARKLTNDFSEPEDYSVSGLYTVTATAKSGSIAAGTVIAVRLNDQTEAVATLNEGNGYTATILAPISPEDTVLVSSTSEGTLLLSFTLMAHADPLLKLDGTDNYIKAGTESTATAYPVNDSCDNVFSITAAPLAAPLASDVTIKLISVTYPAPSFERTESVVGTIVLNSGNGYLAAKATVPGTASEIKIVCEQDILVSFTLVQKINTVTDEYGAHDDLRAGEKTVNVIVCSETNKDYGRYLIAGNAYATGVMHVSVSAADGVSTIGNVTVTVKDGQTVKSSVTLSSGNGYSGTVTVGAEEMIYVSGAADDRIAMCFVPAADD